MTLRDPAAYAKYYGGEHPQPQTLTDGSWVYGLPELFRDEDELRRGREAGYDFDKIVGGSESLGRVLGVVSDEAADRTVHPEAVYLHQGETWAVTDLDRAEGQALVTAVRRVLEKIGV